MNNYLRAKSGKVHSGNRDVGSIPHYMKILRLINYDDVSKIIYNDEECKEIDKILSQNSQYEG